jgi:Tol biopolymer transport system component
MYMFNIDGSGLRVLTDTDAIQLRWAPSGASVIFSDLASPQHLVSVDTTGSTHLLDSTDAARGITASTPAYSADSKTIYYTRQDSTGHYSIYSLAADGSTPPQSVASQHSIENLWPAPSPDGAQLAFVHNGLTLTLTIATFASGTVSNTGLDAASPVWSPLGDVIAYVQGVNPAPVATAKPDGTGVHVLTGPSYGWGIDWSPDGQWIVAANESTDRLDLINATTGQVISLPFTTGYAYPTWRPSAGSASNARTRPHTIHTGRATQSLRRHAPGRF